MSTRKPRLEIRWTELAHKDLASALTFLHAESPRAADGLAKVLESSLEQLREFPAMGRAGRLAGTREILLPGWPYLVPYRVMHGSVEVLRVYHSSRKWPSRIPKKS